MATFAAVAAASVARAVLDHPDRAQAMGSVVVGAVAAVVAVALFVRRERAAVPRIDLALPVGALALIAARGALWPDPAVNGPLLALVLAWVALVRGRRGVAWFAGPAAAAVFLPYVGRIVGTGAVYGAAGATLIAVAVGEIVASLQIEVRATEETDRRRLLDLEALLRATVRLVRENDANDIVGIVADSAVELLRARGAAIVLAEPSGTFRPAGHRDWPPPHYDVHLSPPPGLRDVTWLAESPFGELPAPSAATAVLALPLRARAVDMGWILVSFVQDVSARRNDPFTIELAGTFATQASLAIERLSATQTLVDATLRDELTGVGNRRRAEVALSQLAAGDAVAIIDLDFFKAVNDRWGHPAGDRVLQRLGTHLGNVVRDGDTVSRYGGEEFLLTLRQVRDRGYEMVSRAADEWRQAKVGTTFSAGIAVHRQGDQPSATVLRADRALYAAKESGRDRVVLAPSIEPVSQMRPGVSPPGEGRR